MRRFVKIVGSDGFDSVLCDGEVVFFGPSLAVSAWVERTGVFVSDVVGD